MKTAIKIVFAPVAAVAWLVVSLGALLDGTLDAVIEVLWAVSAEAADWWRWYWREL